MYLYLMAEWCFRCKVEVWAYSLMPNHVHLIAVPESADGLQRAIGEAHRRYTRRVNFRAGWRGHLWQGRFAAFPMDERYLLVAARFVELNSVRAKLVEKPEVYSWSSAAARISGSNDVLVKVSPLLEMVKDWREFLSEAVTEQQAEEIRCLERTGRPLGDENFVVELEKVLNRILRYQKPEPKRKVSQR